MFLLSTSTSAQVSHFESFIHKIDSLGRIIISPVSDEIKRNASLSITKKLESALHSFPDSLQMLDSNKYVSRLSTDNNEIQIYTWTIPLQSGAYEFAGIMRSTDIFFLNDATQLFDSPINEKLTHDEWYGAVYYEMVEQEIGDTTLFTLIGWKGKDKVITKKVIDVLYFDEEGNPFFGAPIFQFSPDSVNLRSIYTFSAEVSMSIKFNEEYNKIVMDHLFPSDPALKGHYEFYGPDLSFDAMSFSNGKWNYIEDFDPGIRPGKDIKSNFKESEIYKP